MANLHGVFVRVAVYELSRRRGQLGAISGPEFDDVAHQAADDALVNVLAKLGDFRGLSRFTTWAYKFVVFEVSGKVARHAWRPAAAQPSRARVRARAGLTGIPTWRPARAARTARGPLGLRSGS